MSQLFDRIRILRQVRNDVKTQGWTKLTSSTDIDGENVLLTLQSVRRSLGADYTAFAERAPEGRFIFTVARSGDRMVRSYTAEWLRAQDAFIETSTPHHRIDLANARFNARVLGTLHVAVQILILVLVVLGIYLSITETVRAGFLVLVVLIIIVRFEPPLKMRLVEKAKQNVRDLEASFKQRDDEWLNARKVK